MYCCHCTVDCLPVGKKGHNELITERQWRITHQQSQPEVVLQSQELLALSDEKMRQMQQASAWEDQVEEMADAWRIGVARTIALDTARRVPLVTEILEGSGHGGSELIEAQL